MYERVSRLYNEGKYRTALKLALRVLAMAEQAYGTEDSRYAAVLSDVATLHTALADFPSAEPLMIEALRIVRAEKGETDPEVAKVLNNLAELYSRMENYPKAEEANLRCVAIRKQTLGDLDVEYALSLNNLAALYHRMGRFKDAEIRFSETLRIRRAVLSQDDPAISLSLNNLAATQHSLGKYRLSEENYLLALEMSRQRANAESKEGFDLRSNLAALYSTMGKFEESASLHTMVLEFRRTTLGERHPDFASSVNSLAGQFHMGGKYAEAEPLYLKSLAIRRAVLGETHSETAASWNNLASLYQDMGSLKKALPLYRKALSIRRKLLGEHHPDYLQNLNNLAGLWESMEDYDEAESLYLQVLNLRRQSLGEDHIDYAQSLNNLAGLYYLMDRYDEIEPLLLESLRTWRTAVGEEHPDVALNINNLAAYYYAVGNHSRAEELYRDAIRLNNQSGRVLSPDYATNLNNLAVLLAATGRDMEALGLKEKASEIDDRILGQIFSVSSETQQMAFLRNIRTSTESFLSLVLERLPTDSSAVTSAFHLVQRRKGAGAQALAAQREAILGGKYPHLREQLKQLSNLRAELAQRLLAGPGSSSLDFYVKEIQSMESERDQLEDALVRSVPEMDIEKELRLANILSISTAVPKGSVLIEVAKFDFFNFSAVPSRGDPLWRPARYAAFVLPEGRPDRIELIDLGEAKAIEEALNNFRSSITEEEKEPATLIPGSDPALRELVFDPLVAALNDSTHLLIAPDGDLTRLPYEVLPGGGEGHLVDRYQISYLSVGRDILRFKEQRKDQRAGPPIVVAAPDFNLAMGSHPGARLRPVKRTFADPYRRYFGKLDGTKLEGESVARLLGVDPWIGPLALEGPLKRSESPRVIHMATHGLFLPAVHGKPEHSHLPLSGPLKTMDGSKFIDGKIHSFVRASSWRDSTLGHGASRFLKMQRMVYSQRKTSAE